MKEHPIIFSTEMIKAILDGRKTQTRRIIKPQPFYGTTDWHSYTCWNFEKGKGRRVGFSTSNHGEQALIGFCPFGQVGSALWVRETFSVAPEYKPVAYPERIPPVFYKADNDKPTWANKWTPSIFMPRWASRITLEITGVRVERLQEITEDDCGKEGIPNFKHYPENPVVNVIILNKHEHFKSLWDSINAKRGYGWDTNPWVWVIEFGAMGVRIK